MRKGTRISQLASEIEFAHKAERLTQGDPAAEVQPASKFKISFRVKQHLGAFPGNVSRRQKKNPMRCFENYFHWFRSHPIKAIHLGDVTRNQAARQCGHPTILMLWTIFVILLVLWLLGFIGHVAGGFIHILLVIAVIVLVIRLVTGRAP